MAGIALQEASVCGIKVWKKGRKRGIVAVVVARGRWSEGVLEVCIQRNSSGNPETITFWSWTSLAQTVKQHGIKKKECCGAKIRLPRTRRSMTVGVGTTVRMPNKAYKSQQLALNWQHRAIRCILAYTACSALTPIKHSTSPASSCRKIPVSASASASASFNCFLCPNCNMSPPQLTVRFAATGAHTHRTLLACSSVVGMSWSAVNPIMIFTRK